MDDKRNICRLAPELGSRAPPEKRKILLILNNSASHPHTVDLTNIELLYLPANTTSMLQPLQVIIGAAKAHCRCEMCSAIIRQLDRLENTGAPQLARTISIFDVINLLNSWKELSKAAIINCWEQSGLVSECEVGSYEPVHLEGQPKAPDFTFSAEYQNLLAFRPRSDQYQACRRK